jgi:ADP-ribosyl-[dinitrogen reductase] hydrolase
MGVYQYRSEEWQALLPWVERRVPVPPGPDGRDLAVLADRTRGMLLGVAIGDSLGNTSEGMTPVERRRLHGEIVDYLPHPREDMRRIGFPSDDTQFTFWTVESLLRRGYLDPADLAGSFVGPRIFGVGKTVTDFLFAYRFGHKPWYQAGGLSAGNGALMRIAPVILPHLHDMTERLWRDVVAATIVTHRDAAAVAASAGFVGLLAECLAWRGAQAPPAHWWPETFLRYARPMEASAAAGSRAGKSSSAADSEPGNSPPGVYASRIPGDSFRGSLGDRVEQTVFPAIEEGLSVLEAAERWHSGAYLLETVPCALYILALHGADAEEAIVRAVNDTRDNDTIAAVVGAAVGALHGSSGLPARWQEPLLGRTVEDDDGHVQALIERAVQAFVAREGRPVG